MRTFTAVFVLAALSASLTAQHPDVARKELAKIEAAAGRNPAAMMKAADYAKEHGLPEEAKRIWQSVLKLDPKHEAANLALGNELLDGVWMTVADAAKARKRAHDAELEAKGLVEVGEIWVPKEQAEDAKRGIFRVGDQVVTKGEFVEMTNGKVRHPITGELIDAKDLEQAKSRHFPIGKDGRWVDEAEADKHHGDLGRPWVFRSPQTVFLTTLPIAKFEAIKTHAERAMARLGPILGFATPLPANRPTILIASSQGEYRKLGTSMGDASSAFGAFLAQEGVQFSVPLQGDVRPVCCLWDDGWGPYNLPHGVGLAYVSAFCAELDTEVPLWFLHAMGAYASRFESPETGAWFAQRLAKAGGLKDLGPWFRAFTIDGTMEFDELDASMTQAGLLIDFCVNGRDAEATKGMQAVTAAFASRKASAIDRAVKDLQTTLSSRQSQVADYLVKLVKERG